MMNVDDCRKRAEQCLAAAQYASDRDIQRTWRELSDLWLFWSEQLVQFSAKNKAPSEVAVNAENGKMPVAAANNAENGNMPVAAAEPIIEDAITHNGKAREMADQLRLMLSLSEVNDA
jgi:hypothetical protein